MIRIVIKRVYFKLLSNRILVVKSSFNIVLVSIQCSLEEQLISVMQAKTKFLEGILII